MTILIAIIGSALIFLGRKTFWLSIFAGTFLLNSQILHYLLFDAPEITIWIISAILSSVCVLLYFSFEKTMIILVGAAGGGFLASQIVKTTGLLTVEHLSEKAIIFIVGGIVGVLLFRLTYEWAMKILTSLIGAYLITSLIQNQPIFELFALIALSIMGIAVQNGIKEKHSHPGGQPPFPEIAP